MVTGIMQPRKISRIFEPLPKPSQITVTGNQRRLRQRIENLDQRAEQHVDRLPPRHDDAERGADHDRQQQPHAGAIERGAGVADQLAGLDADRSRLTTTSLSGGSADDETSSSRAAISQSDREQNAAADSGTSRLHGVRVPLRLDRLVAHQVPDLVDLVDERLGLEHAGIVLVELGVDDGLDAAGPRRHHRDAVGEIDRLLHVVGDEDHGLRRALPDARAAPPASGAGSARRARRTARPSAGCSDRRRACGRARCAASCRRKAATDSCPRSRSGRPDR